MFTKKTFFNNKTFSIKKTLFIKKKILKKKLSSPKIFFHPKTYFTKKTFYNFTPQQPMICTLGSVLRSCDVLFLKLRIGETMNLITDADSSTNILGKGGPIIIIFFFSFLNFIFLGQFFLGRQNKKMVGRGFQIYICFFSFLGDQILLFMAVSKSARLNNLRKKTNHFIFFISYCMWFFISP